MQPLNLPTLALSACVFLFVIYLGILSAAVRDVSLFFVSLLVAQRHVYPSLHGGCEGRKRSADSTTFRDHVVSQTSLRESAVGFFTPCRHSYEELPLSVRRILQLTCLYGAGVLDLESAARPVFLPILGPRKSNTISFRVFPF